MRGMKEQGPERTANYSAGNGESSGLRHNVGAARRVLDITEVRGRSC
jgi:hypothetical protein